MNQLPQKACDEAREGNSSIKQLVRDIGNKSLNSVEISAQEAVYIVLQLSMRKSSRQVIFNENYDLSSDLGIPSTSFNNEPQILNELPDDDYRQMVQTLNEDQKDIFYQIKTSESPVYCFLTGGAGVGKSHLTKALNQAALKYYNTKAGDDFDQIKVILLGAN